MWNLFSAYLREKCTDSRKTIAEVNNSNKKTYNQGEHKLSTLYFLQLPAYDNPSNSCYNKFIDYVQYVSKKDCWYMFKSVQKIWSNISNLWNTRSTLI